jgi:hypothetical protein
MRYVFVYGSLSGLVIILTIMAGVVFAKGSFFNSEVFGYLVMLVALTFIFVGVKRYRDIERGGVIGFGRALAIGLGIAVVASAIYVGVWEIYLASTDYAFMGDYTAAMIRHAEASRMKPEALAALRTEMATLATNYMNPLFRIPMTFAEIFPVGLLVSLVSAALLRMPGFFPARVPVRAPAAA